MITICGADVSTSALAYAVVVVVLLVALLGLSVLANWLQGRYEHRETVRRLTGFAHAHRWTVGESVDGRAMAECTCGADRVFLEVVR